MNPKQIETLWIGSFRYYLGRRTAAVGDFCELLIQEWGNLPQFTQELIQKELTKAIKDDDEARQENSHPSFGLPLGDDCDREDWLKVLKHINGAKK